MGIDINAISRRLNEPGGRITIGIDGFVDEVWQVVESRAGVNEYAIFNHIRRFGEHIAQRGEGGMANEIIRKRRGYGGFTANTGNAITCFGVETVMLALFGKNTIDPVFEPLDGTGAARVISIGEPAVCHIFEFDDGKAMFPYNKAISDLDWQYLIKALPLDTLKQCMGGADIIAIGYWSNMPAFDDLVLKICANLLNAAKQQRMFFDLADITKRDKTALLNTLSTLGDLNAKIPMTLSLNEHEAERLFSYMGERFSMEAGYAAESAERVRQKTGLAEIVVHTPNFALAASRFEGTVTVRQQYCNNPVRTAGAGDTFNGGYMVAAVKKLPVRERLAVANATTGFFIKNGYAPNQEEVTDEIQLYYGNE